MTAIVIILIVLEPVMMLLGAYLAFSFLRMGIKFDTGRDIKLELPKLMQKKDVSNELDKEELKTLDMQEQIAKSWFYQSGKKK